MNGKYACLNTHT